MGPSTPVQGSSNTPYEWLCPGDGFLSRYYGYSGLSGSNWVAALGPVECSDGTNNTDNPADIWVKSYVNVGGQQVQGVPFANPATGSLPTGCSGFNVTYAATGINKLDFSAQPSCGDVVAGGFSDPSGVTVSLRCPDDMRVVGVYGTYDELGNTGLNRIGLYCR